MLFSALYDLVRTSARRKDRAFRGTRQKLESDHGKSIVDLGIVRTELHGRLGDFGLFACAFSADSSSYTKIQVWLE